MIRERWKVRGDRWAARWYFKPADSTSRFGGGWHWVVGVKVSRDRRTIIVELLVGALRIERIPTLVMPDPDARRTYERAHR